MTLIHEGKQKCRCRVCNTSTLIGNMSYIAGTEDESLVSIFTGDDGQQRKLTEGEWNSVPYTDHRRVLVHIPVVHVKSTRHPVMIYGLIKTDDDTEITVRDIYQFYTKHVNDYLDVSGLAEYANSTGLLLSDGAEFGNYHGIPTIHLKNNKF